MKQKLAWYLPIFACPILFAFFLKPPLDALFSDPRPIYRAEPLEAIKGSEAGARVDAPATTEPKFHTVKAGDTWWSLAKAYGVQDPNALASYNNNLSLIPGIKIEIPREMMEVP